VVVAGRATCRIEQDVPGVSRYNLLDERPNHCRRNKWRSPDVLVSNDALS